MTFGSWSPESHDGLDQLKRICSARKISANKITVDKDTETAVVSGSSSTPYNVTLNHCDCGDFSIRNLPCKHIYRLALDLGYLSDLPVYDKKLAKEVSFEDEINRYYSLYVHGALSADNFVKIADTLSKLKP